MKPFYEQPILNSPYHPPTHHHAFDEHGQPLDQAPLVGRRRSRYVLPVPPYRRQQPQLDLGAYTDNDSINLIRTHVEAWRALPSPADWGVTPVTQRLLQHWRHHDFAGPRPFFCQVEAVETAIWLTEVAPRKKRLYGSILAGIEAANAEANPGLLRLALKLATGAGKTTVMAMLIAWQAVNAARQPGSSLFSRGFLVITPGITIKDRLRVLLPADEDNYYTTRELVPPDMMNDLRAARIVISNYHAFQQREVIDTNKVGQALLAGWREEPVRTRQTEGEMLKDVCRDLLEVRNVTVINDEAHHCYRERQGAAEEREARGEEAEEARTNREAARLWISGIEALNRKVGVRAVYDLSATPFFLRGSGYREGTLFPWVVSDFSLVDAIECGIVKLPRVPVSDNVVNAKPVFRNLWDHIGGQMPKKGAAKSGSLDPLARFPPELETALLSLYGHYVKTFELWRTAGIGVPPVFIVVCNNTASSRLVYEWISGWTREDADGNVGFHNGRLELFRNFDENTGQPLERMNTILVDSYQIESGTLDDSFKAAAASEIEKFRQQKATREGAASAGAVSDAEVLREVMNTVGQKGRLGEHVRCVVSVSMLTEGWDARTVTHILGARAFGTQLLCEQVVGRGLRRQSYEPGDRRTEEGHRLFDTEYADILGIPFDFASEETPVEPKPPRPVTRVAAVKGREHLSIRLPRVAGYRTALPTEELSAVFGADSHLRLTPDDVGPTMVRMEGLVGEGHDLTPEFLDTMRVAQIATHLSKQLIEKHLSDGHTSPPYHLYYAVQPIVRRWIAECLHLEGGARAGMLTYATIAGRAAELIAAGIRRASGGADTVTALLDPYNPAVVTDHVQFITSKTRLYATRLSHVNFVVGDSGWELAFADVLERHPATLAYVKNQALGFEVPYLENAAPRHYLPDFVVKVDDGRGAGDPLHLVVEIKGERDTTDQIKAETMRSLWLPGVNRLGTFGRWAFIELREKYMGGEYDRALAALADNGSN